MQFYAHTAKDESGKPALKSEWQLLRDHLLQVAELAQGFAAPFSLEKEAFLAGLLHDLGKYAGRFQARLDDHSIHGVNHWAAGAARAAELKAWCAAFSVDGHHTGIPALNENSAGPPLRETAQKFSDDCVAP